MSLDKDPANEKVDQIMTSPLISVEIGTSAYEVYRTMADRNIRHLLITKDGEQVGFLSVKDLIAKPTF